MYSWHSLQVYLYTDGLVSPFLLVRAALGQAPTIV